jgi:hypothetical protein
MVKFNIGLKSSEMKNNIQLQIFDYFMTIKTTRNHTKKIAMKFH